MAKTLAQKAADRQLDEAVQRVAAAYGLLGESMLIDYVVVLEGGRFGDEDGESHYEHFALAFRHGNVRSVVGIGLLHKGMALMEGSDG